MRAGADCARRMALAALAATLAACDPSAGGALGGPGDAVPPMTGPGGGLAAAYPGDAGIESHPDVIFTETFEEESLAAVFERWSDVRGAPSLSLDPDVPTGSPGARSLAIAWEGGVSDGGHLYRQLGTDVGRTLHVRYYVKHPARATYAHSGIWMGGYRPPLPWPDPQAGIKPAGDDRFSAAAEQNTRTNRFDHYDYWLDMRPSADGRHWGNLLLNDPGVQARPGEWTCVEHMVTLNDPVTASNGERAIWLAGVKVSHLGPGFPRGSWTGGLFQAGPGGQPFEGFRWRSDPGLGLNWIWLQAYAPDAVAGARGEMRFDHVVVARSRIGCLEPRARARGAAPSDGGAWPNEPAGMTPVSDQRWERMAAGSAQGGGPLGRIARRLRSFVGPREKEDPWGYLRRGSSRDDAIVRDDGAPMSPPDVLRIVFTPDMGRDREPSVHWVGLPRPREVFAAWWMRLSPNWTASPAGGGKIAFLHAAPDGQGQVYSNVGGSRPPHRIDVNTEWAPYGQRFWEPNVHATPVGYGTWHRVEWHVRWESRPGASDGLLRWWVDGALNGEHAGAAFPAAGAGFQQFEFAPTRQLPPAAEQYLDVDHTYVSVR